MREANDNFERAICLVTTLIPSIPQVWPARSGGKKEAITQKSPIQCNIHPPNTTQHPPPTYLSLSVSLDGGYLHNCLDVGYVWAEFVAGCVRAVFIV